MINRWFYTRLWQFAPPLIRRYLKKRGRKSPAYLENWGERFGEPLPDPVQRPVWIHAVSVGETRAAQPLAEALRRHFPDAPRRNCSLAHNAVICPMTVPNGCGSFCANTTRCSAC